MTGDVLLFIGTRRGLFIARSDYRRETWSISPPLLAGREVYHALLDPRDGRTAWAATKHAVWGAHVHRSADRGETWDVLESSPQFADQRGLIKVWALAPGPPSRPDTVFAGIEPAGLFVSDDRGASWRGIDALNEHRTRKTWQPAGGGLALHSIVIDPTDEARMFCAISAGGVYRTENGGKTWKPANAGTRADFLPEKYPASGQCVHKLILHPRRPARLYQQNHCGVYRSDDHGDSWIEITAGLPSDFGYAIALDPTDPDTLFVIPEESSDMRATVDGKLRVFRSRDAGKSWSTLKRGLPQSHAYVSILREGMAADTHEQCGIYFGTSGGHLFGSRDRGESWRPIASYLPRILSVTASVMDR